MADTLQLWWEGPDGSAWELLDPRSPVRLVAADGLGLPTFTQQFAATGARDGRRYEGTLWGHSDVSLTVEVGDIYVPDGYGRRRRGEDWRALDAVFRGSVSPEAVGRLVAVTGAGRRFLELRLDAPIAAPPGLNPAVRGSAVYLLEMTADDQPWWYGEECTAEFGWAQAGQPFFGGSDGSVLFFISPTESLSTAAITNPGERPAWPRWWARGPFTSVTVGLGGDVATLPFARAAGQTVYVDSLAQTIVDQAGVSLWPSMGFADPTFAPVPAGESVPLVTTITGGGAGAAIGLGITPLFGGPW